KILIIKEYFTSNFKMNFTKDNGKNIFLHFGTFLNWLFRSIIVGLICGFVGVAFHFLVDWATITRQENPWLLYLLPLGGIIIVFLYKITKSHDSYNTNYVFNSIRKYNKVPVLMAPLIFISTVLTHLFGGSAGREGAALQMGGSLGCTIGRIFKVNNESMKILIMCGMSAVFTALFSTPITATVFSIEVISVGVFYHSALVPCLISSISAYFVTTLFSIPKLNFSFLNIPEFSIELVFPIIILAIACGICSIIFCTAIKTTSVLNAKLFKNNYIKIIVGGFIIIVLTLLVNTTDYNGAGMDIIFKAVNGYAKPEAFALKILFTAITIGVGFKGGEIVPTLFVGATFGNIIGGLI
ncbi:MAG: chloride channel protein, partial [Clostridia bacterium]